MCGNITMKSGEQRQISRSQDIEGDYEKEIAAEILSWPDMINN